MKKLLKSEGMEGRYVNKQDREALEEIRNELEGIERKNDDAFGMA